MRWKCVAGETEGTYPELSTDIDLTGMGVSGKRNIEVKRRTSMDLGLHDRVVCI